MKKTSGNDLIDSSVSERILLQLFLYALSSNKDSSQSPLKTIISLEGYYSTSQDYDEDFDMIEITEETIKQLKSADIIKSCSDFSRGDEDPEDYETAYATCTYYPNKVTAQLEKIWKPKRENVQKLIPVYQKFTELVLEHLKAPVSLDKNSNEYYLQLKDEIINLTQLDPGLVFSSYIPFESLYSAREELDKKNITLRKVSNKMLDFYGKLVEEEKNMDLEKYRKGELDLQKIDDHISYLKVKNTEIIPTYKGYKNTRAKKPFSGDLKEVYRTGKLVSYNDGTISFNSEPLSLRSQLRDLCRLFMGYPEQLITIDDIKETIIKATKRKDTPDATISKYVSELSRLLEIHFKRKVIFNQKEDGWYLKLKS